MITSGNQLSKIVPVSVVVKNSLDFSSVADDYAEHHIILYMNMVVEILQILVRTAQLKRLGTVKTLYDILCNRIHQSISGRGVAQSDCDIVHNIRYILLKQRKVETFIVMDFVVKIWYYRFNKFRQKGQLQ